MFLALLTTICPLFPVFRFRLSVSGSPFPAFRFPAFRIPALRFGLSVSGFPFSGSPLSGFPFFVLTLLSVLYGQ